jgi:hypothetical protein
VSVYAIYDRKTGLYWAGSAGGNYDKWVGSIRSANLYPSRQLAWELIKQGGYDLTPLIVVESDEEE